MSEGNEEVVRRPLAVGARSRRSLDERLALRFPRAAALVAAAVWRLPRRSRLRQAVIHRAVVLGWESMNRMDFEAGLALYHPDVESAFDPAGRALGFQDTRGRDTRLAMLRRIYGEFREFRFDPDELIDLGDDRLLVVGRMRGRGVSSGAPFDTYWANLWTISAGLVIRDEAILNRPEALQAAGLSE